MSSLVSGLVIVVTVDHWTEGARRRIILVVVEVRRRSADELLTQARGRITRFAPERAWAALRAGEGLIVDIRSDEERRHDGIVPGSLHVPRTVLEWRADQESRWANPHIVGCDGRLILLCAHGWSSSLAAATLVELGYPQAGDVDGGFAAWRSSGLPTAPATERPPGVLPGMGSPD